MPGSEREGDYSSVEVDPTDGTTFWAANEYIGADGGTDIWRTHIASFQATVDPGANFYVVRVKGGDSLDITVNVPAAGPVEFASEFVPAVYLYDSSGNLVAFDEAQDSNDRTVDIHFEVPGNGRRRYTIQVAPSPLTPQPTQGEYSLVVSGSEDDGSETAAAAAMATSGPIRAEASGPIATVGGGDGRGAIAANFFATEIRDTASSRAAESGSGGAGRNVGASSTLTASVVETLDRPEGPLRVLVAGRRRARGLDKSDMGRSLVQRRAGVAIVKSRPEGKSLLKPGATFERVDNDCS
jgi:hypothetical protein